MNRCVVITEAKKLEIREIDMPVCGQGEALLKLLYGGICGSDLSTFRGTFSYSTFPRIPGHEFSAEIAEIGANDAGLEKGMVVTANPYFNCGECYSCRRGLVNCCTTNQTMGVQREGAFANYIAMPVQRIYSAQGIGAKELALAEPFCIGYHGIKRADIKPGERVLILGAGTIGVLSMAAAKRFGAKVYMSDVSQSKLDYALKLGADGAILNSSKQSFDSMVDEITGGDGFDVTVEAVGMPSTFQDCIDAAAFGARVVVIGVAKQNLDFNFTMIQKKELHILGSRNAVSSDFNEVLDIIKSKEFPLEKIITDTYRFEDAAKAFEDFDKNSASMLKVILEF